MFYCSGTRMKEKLKSFYERKYKALLLIPFLLLFFAFVQIGVQYATTGDFVHKGITLKGGSTITINYVPSYNLLELETSLQQTFPKAEIALRTLHSAGQITSFAIDSDAQQDAEIKALLAAIKEEINVLDEDYSVEVIGSSLGRSFFRQTLTAIGIAFILMGIVVFIYFRTVVPSLAVILAAFSDIFVTLAIFNLTGIKLNAAGIAAFLMLVGYSVDTDMVLSSRVLKRREGTVMERIYSSIQTGLMMSATTLAAVITALLLVKSDVVKQIMLILLIGLLVDLVMTWIQNVAILRWYLESKEKKNALKRH